RAIPVLRSEGVLVHDWSNRSGFDKYANDFYVWEYWFAKRSSDEVIVSEIDVWLRYEEPLEVCENVRVECKWCAQVYHKGSTPFFSKGGTQSFSVQECASDAMLRIIHSKLRLAKRSLPVHYKIGRSSS